MDSTDLSTLPLASKTAVDWLMSRFADLWSAKLRRSTDDFYASLHDYSGHTSFYIDLSREGYLVTVKVHGKGVFADPGSKLSEEFKQIITLMHETVPRARQLDAHLEYYLLADPMRLDRNRLRPRVHAHTVMLRHRTIIEYPNMLHALQTETVSGFVVKFDMSLSDVVFDNALENALVRVAESIVRLPTAITIYDAEDGTNFTYVFWDAQIAEEIHGRRL